MGAHHVPEIDGLALPWSKPVRFLAQRGPVRVYLRPPVPTWPGTGPMRLR